MDRINYTVTGYPKSGTTWLSRIMFDLVKAQKGLFVGPAMHVFPDSFTKNLEGYDTNNFVFKSHNPNITYRLAKREFGPTVLIIRDIRDIVVSAKPFFKMENYERTYEFIKDGIRMAANHNWSQHYNSWKDKAYILRYEDLLLNPEMEIRKINDYLNLNRSEDDIDSICQKHCFQNMKNILPEIVNIGEIGRFRNELSEQLIDEIIFDHGSVLVELGYING